MNTLTDPHPPRESAPPAPHAPPAPPAARVVDVCLRYLKAENVGVVFGVPGGLLHPFFDAVEQDEDLRLVVTRHEEGAAFMADGYARTGHRLGVCAGTSGPGSTNLLTGVACALADGVPLLVLTGQAATHALGKGAAQETAREDIDIVAMFRPVTKYSAMVTSPGSFGRHMRRALRAAFMGRPGPVHLNLPVDLWHKPLDESWFDPATFRADTRSFDRLAVQRAATALVEADRPVILAGSGVGVAGAQAHLHALASLLNARVATTPRAKGVFPEDDPRSLGVFGVAGHREARDTLLGDEVDVLLAAGTSLNETGTLNWDPKLRPGKAFIQLDIDPERIGRNYAVDIALVGDAQGILVEIVYHVYRLIRAGHRPRSSWHRMPAPAGPQARCEAPDARTSSAVPVTPQRWRADLEAVLPADALVFSDIGGHMLFNIHQLCLRERQQFVLNLGFGSMGHGTVAPIGAAFAHPGRPVLAIVGDACFTMNGMELLTAVEHDVPVIWIVENNHMHGITWHGSGLLGRPLAAVKYRRPLQVAAIAQAMGLRTWVVEAPGQMQGAVAQALGCGGPALIEVRVDGTICPPLGARTQSLAGFIE